ETAGHPHPGRSGASLQVEILVSGTAGTGEALVLTAPISFWGGGDPMPGRLADVRPPRHGHGGPAHVLVAPGTTRSARARRAALGRIVAREMGWKTPAAVRLDRDRFARFHGRQVKVEDGRLVASA